MSADRELMASVSVTPDRVRVTPGIPTPLMITITNTADIIGGYKVRLLGVDPSWVELGDAQVSLFPDETRVVHAMLTIPPGLVAGERQMSVHVQEETPPYGATVVDVVLDVPAAPEVKVRVDPVIVTGGSKGSFSLLVDNTGNTHLDGHLLAQDAESTLRYTFRPPVLNLAPGAHETVEMLVRGKRPVFGSPLVRLVTLHVRDGVPPPTRTTTKDLRVGRRKKDAAALPAEAAAPEEEKPADANATFVQKARFARGAMSLVGLLVAVTVFAVVISLALNGLVRQSAEDRDLALKIAAAQDADAAGTGTLKLSGRVQQATDGRGAEGVEVSLFSAADVTTPVAKAVSDRTGLYVFRLLPPGDYKVYYSGAGLQKQWYPQAISPDDAATVTLEEGTPRLNVPVVPLGGLPGSIEGTVVGVDVADSTITLRSLLAVPVGDPDYDAEVTSAAVDPDGRFVLGDVPSPSTFNLEVSKPGFATSVQKVSVQSGETVTGIKIALVRGNGSVTGNIVTNDPDAKSDGIRGATVTLTSEDTSVTAITEGRDGGFVLDHLPTPASYTLTVSAPGFSTETLAIGLSEGQAYTGVSVSLVNTAGRIQGTTSVVSDDGIAASGGVAVTVSDGEHVVQTASTSPVPGADDTGTGRAAAGAWSVDGLAVPGTFNITFSRADLASQTISVSLDAAGSFVGVSQGVVVDADGVIQTTLRSARGEIAGLVTQLDSAGSAGVEEGVGEAQVTLTSGTTTYSVVTATAPVKGAYHVSDVVPGVYTVTVTLPGARPESSMVNVVAGGITSFDPQLGPGASLSITVVDDASAPLAGYYVRVYRRSAYPGTVYRTAQTGSDGVALLANVGAPELYVVEVARGPRAGPVATRRLQAVPGETTPVTIEVSSNG